MQSLFSARTLVFDVDGTLVDSNDQHAIAFELAFNAFGYGVPYYKIRQCIGMGSEKLIPEVMKARPLTDAEIKKIGEKKEKIFKQKFLWSIRPFPKVFELMGLLKVLGLPLAVASSGSKKDIQHLLKLAKITDLIGTVISAEQVSSSKPEPDVILTALQKLKLPASEVIMVGDTPYDIQASQKAGVPCFAFRCGGWTNEDLKGAEKIFDGPWDLYCTIRENQSQWRQSVC